MCYVYNICVYVNMHSHVYIYYIYIYIYVYTHVYTYDIIVYVIGHGLRGRDLGQQHGLPDPGADRGAGYKIVQLIVIVTCQY